MSKPTPMSRTFLVLLVYLVASILGALGSTSNGSTISGTATTIPTAAPLQGLWVANGAIDVLEFLASQFVAGGAVAPHLTNSTFIFDTPQDALFAADGSLWVVDGGGRGANDPRGTGAAAFRFSPTQLTALAANPHPTPVFEISKLRGPITFKWPRFAAFDSRGNLWISDVYNSVIFEFTAQQLTAKTGVGLTPAAVLTGSKKGDFKATLGIAFDKSGDLWIANNGDTTIVEVTAAQLAAAKGITRISPITRLNSTRAGGLDTIKNPWGILFDSSGNMWFTNEQLSVSNRSGSIVEFGAGTFGGQGSITPKPRAVFTQVSDVGVESLCDPNGIALSLAGFIAVANAGNSSIVGYSPAQLRRGGTVLPITLIKGEATTLNGPTGLVFGPNLQ